MSSTDEEWRPVVGYGGAYQASSHGRIRSLDRWSSVNGGQRLHRGRVLRAHPYDDAGHLCVELSHDGVKRTVAVHRLVAEAFHGPAPSGTEVCHGNGNAGDNRPENLRWDTHRNNIGDAIGHGTHAGARERCPRGHGLVAPNLVRCRSDKRECLACSRGSSTVRNAARRGVTLDLQTEADRHHARIVAGLAPVRRRPTTAR